MLQIPINIHAAYMQILASVGKATPFTITAEEKDGKAIVYIKGYIHEWSSASAIELEAQVLALKDAGYEDATVYVNSRGGQTIEASEILNVLRLFTGKLIGVAGSIVASAATYILCKLDEVWIRPNTQYMWHKPRAVIEGTAAEIEAGLKRVKDVELDYLKTYAEQTGKTEKVLAAKWDNGDQWMIGQEIVDEGFANKVISVKAKITASDVESLVACGALVIPEITAKIETKNTERMKLDPLKIGLTADATDAEIEARLLELNASAGKVEALEQEKATADAEALETEVNAVLDQAINVDKKFGADLRAKWKGILTADLKGGKELIAGLSGVQKLSAKVGKDASLTDATKAKWTYKEWKEKDPKGLQAMHESDLERFDNLFENRNK